MFIKWFCLYLFLLEISQAQYSEVTIVREDTSGGKKATHALVTLPECSQVLTLLSLSPEFSRSLLGLTFTGAWSNFFSPENFSYFLRVFFTEQMGVPQESLQDYLKLTFKSDDPSTYESIKNKLIEFLDQLFPDINEGPGHAIEVIEKYKALSKWNFAKKIEDYEFLRKSWRSLSKYHEVGVSPHDLVEYILSEIKVLIDKNYKNDLVVFTQMKPQHERALRQVFRGRPVYSWGTLFSRWLFRLRHKKEKNLGQALPTETEIDREIDIINRRIEYLESHLTQEYYYQIAKERVGNTPTEISYYLYMLTPENLFKFIEYRMEMRRKGFVLGFSSFSSKEEQELNEYRKKVINDYSDYQQLLSGYFFDSVDDMNRIRILIERYTIAHLQDLGLDTSDAFANQILKLKPSHLKTELLSNGQYSCIRKVKLKMLDIDTLNEIWARPWSAPAPVERRDEHTKSHQEEIETLNRKRAKLLKQQDVLRSESSQNKRRVGTNSTGLR